MANKQINDFTLKSTPVAADEILIQETGGGTTKKTTLGDAALDILSANTSALTLASNGTVNVAGPAGANNVVEIQAATGRESIFRMQSTDISHGMTSIVPTDVYLEVQSAGDGTVGGGLITGVSEAGTDIPIIIRGYFGVADPTDTVASVQFRSGKKTGTTSTSLAATETAFQFSDHNGGTDFLTITGDGHVGIGDSTPTEAKLVVAESTTTPALFLDQNGNGIALNIDSEATTASVLNIAAANTGGNVAAIINAGNHASDNMLLLQESNASSSATLLSLDQGGNGVGINMLTDATTADGIVIVAESLTTGNAIQIDNNSSDASSRALLFVRNKHASAINASTAEFEQLADGTNVFIDQNGNGIALNIDSEATSAAGISINVLGGPAIDVTGGDVVFTNAGSGLIYGSMYAGAGFTVPIAVATPVEMNDGTATFDGFTAGMLNGITFPTGGTEHYLTVPRAGVYRVEYACSISKTSGGSTEAHVGVMKSGVAIRDNGESHRTISTNSDIGSVGGVTMVDCPLGTEQISLWVINNLSNDLDIEHATMNITMVGGT